MQAIDDYVGGVLDGRIPACESIKLACRRHLRDLETGAGRGLRFNATKARHACEFFPKFLVHSKGEWAGHAFVLEPWQKFVIGSLFGWERVEDDTRRFRSAFLELPRKQGKSSMSAGVGLYLLVADGEPGAEIYTSATKHDQARIVHSEAIRMVRASPVLSRSVRIFKNSLSIDHTASKYEPLGADAGTLDGLNVHGALVDELHAHRSRDLYDVLETATASRRQPLLLTITTAGVGRETVCFEHHDYSLKLLTEALEDDTYFAFVACADEADDWTSPEVWQKCNPNLGVSVKRDDLARKCDRAKNMATAQNAFRRLHLNEWLDSYTGWIDGETWRACGGVVVPDALAGQSCYGGLDLSSNTDVTAFVLLFPQGQVFSRFWIPEANMAERVRRDRVPYDVWVREGLVTATPGNVVDYQFVRHEIKELGKLYDIREIAFDPWGAVQLSTQLAEEDGFQMVQLRQGFGSLSAPTKELERRVLGRQIQHGDNPVLTWMMSNVAVQVDAAENIKIHKGKSTDRVDGIAALIMAVSRDMVQTKKRSVYEDRGIDFI